MKFLGFPVAVLSALFVFPALLIGEETSDETKVLQRMEKLAAGLTPQSGEVLLPGGQARFSLPDSLRYLSPADARTVLVAIWGNPPDGFSSLGLIVPKGFDPLGMEAWAVDINYEEDGHIKDDDAESINYADMLVKMKEGAKAGNAERIKAGYDPVELVGWAATPHYDRATHKLYWAKEIKFGENPENTLNYNIRILGRQGVLVLNAIAGMPQLQEIESLTPELLSAVEFTEGNRYADFNPGTDRLATYGVAALVAGSVATKMGFFKGLWVAILAGKKFVIMGAIALIFGIKKLFSLKKQV
jgi:uncharacterized membrane-anchored protein